MTLFVPRPTKLQEDLLVNIHSKPLDVVIEGSRRRSSECRFLSYRRLRRSRLPFMDYASHVTPPCLLLLHPSVRHGFFTWQVYWSDQFLGNISQPNKTKSNREFTNHRPLRRTRITIATTKTIVKNKLMTHEKVISRSFHLLSTMEDTPLPNDTV